MTRNRSRLLHQPAPIAWSLLVAATRLLPTADQARYMEEFSAELVGIAEGGGSRRVQVTYAAHQLASAWRLRAERRGALAAAVPVPTIAGTIVFVAAAFSMGAAAILTFAVITANIRVTLILSEFAFGGLVLVSAVLFTRLVIARARAASRDNTPLGGA
jgi:hypothetical protein